MSIRMLVLGLLLVACGTQEQPMMDHEAVEVSAPLVVTQVSTSVGNEDSLASELFIKAKKLESERGIAGYRDVLIAYYAAALYDEAPLADLSEFLKKSAELAMQENFKGDWYVLSEPLRELNTKYPDNRQFDGALRVLRDNYVTYVNEFASKHGINFGARRYTSNSSWGRGSNPFSCSDLLQRVAMLYELSEMIEDRGATVKWGTHYADALLLGDYGCDEGEADLSEPRAAYKVYLNVGLPRDAAKAARAAAEIYLKPYAEGGFSLTKMVYTTPPLDPAMRDSSTIWLMSAGLSDMQVRRELQKRLVASSAKLEDQDEYYAAGLVYGELGDELNQRRMQLLAPNPPDYKARGKVEY